MILPTSADARVVHSPVVDLGPVVPGARVVHGPWDGRVALGGNSIAFFWPEKWPQYQPENWPEMTFEKDICTNYQNWTKKQPKLYCKISY